MNELAISTIKKVLHSRFLDIPVFYHSASENYYLRVGENNLIETLGIDTYKREGDLTLLLNYLIDFFLQKKEKDYKEKMILPEIHFVSLNKLEYILRILIFYPAK